jgi:hypothetical protein
MEQPPRSKAEFETVMVEIDESLRAKGVSIHARDTHAGLAYSRRFKLEFPMAMSGTVGTPANFSDRNVDAHIRDWYIRRYGDRLNISLGPGYVAILIRGDPWRLRLPRIFGQVECVVERDLSKHANDRPLGEAGRLPVVNVLGIIEELPQSLALELSDAECGQILQAFGVLLDCMSRIEDLGDGPYLSEVRADITAAVTHVMAVPVHPGQSKWASSQAAEKLIKSFLKVRGIPFRKSHDLSELASSSKSAGLVLKSSLLAAVATPAGVRYGEVAVSLMSAIEAHHASLLIGREVSAASCGVVPISSGR